MKPSVCARWPPRRAPFLGPTPLVGEPGSYTHSRPSGLRTQGWGVGGCGADLSCCAWQEASQTQQAGEGAGTRKRTNYLKFKSHGAHWGPGGRFRLCLLFYY